MEKLYITDLTINGSRATYEVIFENEAYVFYPKKGEDLQIFAIKREDDEWHPQGQLDNGIKEEAIASLEKYLLSQH